MQELTWTKNKPTVDGYYYLCRHYQDNPDVLFVFVEGGWYFVTGGHEGVVDLEDGLWAGPIIMQTPPVLE